MQLHAARVEAPAVDADRQRPDRPHLAGGSDRRQAWPGKVLGSHRRRQQFDRRRERCRGVGRPRRNGSGDRLGRIIDGRDLHLEAAAGDDGPTVRQVGDRGGTQPEQPGVGRIAQPEDQALAHRTSDGQWQGARPVHRRRHDDAGGGTLDQHAVEPVGHLAAQPLGHHLPPRRQAVDDQEDRHRAAGRTTVQPARQLVDEPRHPLVVGSVDHGAHVGQVRQCGRQAAAVDDVDVELRRWGRRHRGEDGRRQRGSAATAGGADAQQVTGRAIPPPRSLGLVVRVVQQAGRRPRAGPASTGRSAAAAARADGGHWCGRRSRTRPRRSPRRAPRARTARPRPRGPQPSTGAHRGARRPPAVRPRRDRAWRTRPAPRRTLPDRSAAPPGRGGGGAATPHRGRRRRRRHRPRPAPGGRCAGSCWPGCRR